MLKIHLKAVPRVWESVGSGAAAALQRGEPFVRVFPAAESLRLACQSRKSPWSDAPRRVSCCPLTRE